LLSEKELLRNEVRWTVSSRDTESGMRKAFRNSYTQIIRVSYFNSLYQQIRQSIMCEPLHGDSQFPKCIVQFSKFYICVRLYDGWSPKFQYTNPLLCGFLL
jgi:hypothetical protein